MTADTAYQMWGLAAPCDKKEEPVKWPKNDNFQLSIYSKEMLEATIAAYEAEGDIYYPEGYYDYWLNEYKEALKRFV
jgi:hypothetical protein